MRRRVDDHGGGGLPVPASLPEVMPWVFAFLAVMVAFAGAVLVSMPRGVARAGVAVLYAAAFAATYCIYLDDAVEPVLAYPMLSAIAAGLLACSFVAVAIITVTWTIPTA